MKIIILLLIPFIVGGQNISVTQLTEKPLTKLESQFRGIVEHSTVLSDELSLVKGLEITDRFTTAVGMAFTNQDNVKVYFGGGYEFSNPIPLVGNFRVSKTFNKISLTTSIRFSFVEDSERYMFGVRKDYGIGLNYKL